MKKTRFTETQIVSILKLADSGLKVEEICRQNGISNATYYNKKSKYGGMKANDVKRLKERLNNVSPEIYRKQLESSNWDCIR